MGLAQVADEQGKTHTVSYSSANQNEQIVVLASPNPISVEVHPDSMLAQPGATVELAVHVARAADAQVPLEFSLEFPRESRWAKAVQGDPLTVAADAKSGVLQLHFANQLPEQPIRLRIVGTGQQGEDTFVSDAYIELVPLSKLSGE